MRSAIYLLLFLFTCAPAYSQTAYLWVEVKPEWQTKATDYWGRVHGYGKKLPVQIVQSIQQDREFASNDMATKLQKALAASRTFKREVKALNPPDIVPALNDIYIDLQVSAKEISEVYPFFKKELSKFQPEVEFHLVAYGGGGHLAIDTTFSQKVDYKTGIRPKLKSGMSDYEKEPDEYKWTCLTAFDAALPALASLLLKKQKAIEAEFVRGANEQGNASRFKSEMSLLFSARKNSNPNEYASIVIPAARDSFQPVPMAPLSQSVNEPDAKIAFGDSVLAGELAKGLQGAKFYALFVGVSDYDDPQINDLEYPVGDARRLSQILTNYYTFSPENVTLLENPTRGTVIRALDNLAQKVTAKDNLLIFYAGHGVYDDQMKSGFWLPSDAQRNNRADWISNGSLRDYIGGINAKHTLLIADACFSGGIFKTREAFTMVTQADVEMYRLPSRKAMTSGAMKTVPDKSVFLDYLIKRLMENNKHFISSETLFASFKTAVINNSPNSQVPQFGEIRETGDEGGDFIFVRRKY